MRLLLVEDEPDLGSAIKRTLNHEKYVVDFVLDGTEAWSYLENQWTQYTLRALKTRSRSSGRRLDFE